MTPHRRSKYLIPKLKAGLRVLTQQTRTHSTSDVHVSLKKVDRNPSLTTDQALTEGADHEK